MEDDAKLLLNGKNQVCGNYLTQCLRCLLKAGTDKITCMMTKKNKFCYWSQQKKKKKRSFPFLPVPVPQQDWSPVYKAFSLNFSFLCSSVLIIKLQIQLSELILRLDLQKRHPLLDSACPLELAILCQRFILNVKMQS